MENGEIIKNLKIAINLLFSNDFYLISNDLNERSITHKLAEYLQDYFPKFNVDCEYNGATFTLNKRKCIPRIEEELMKIKRKLSSSNSNFLSVFPDIIVHTRRNDNYNILVIEVKKKISESNAKKFDTYKLEAYTANELKYQIGALIELHSKNNKYQISLFEDGKLMVKEVWANLKLVRKDEY